MPRITHRAKDRKDGAQPDLGSWSAPPSTFVRTTDRVAVRIAKRYGLSLKHAITVAHLAGFGSEVSL